MFLSLVLRSDTDVSDARIFHRSNINRKTTIILYNNKKPLSTITAFLPKKTPHSLAVLYGVK